MSHSPQSRLNTAAVQRRTVWTLAAAQVFSGLSAGSTLTLGSILAVQFAGAEVWAGASNTAVTLGTACTAVPLSRMALRTGRRVALASGLCGAIVGTVLLVYAVIIQSFPVLVLGSFGVGVANAVNLQARFAVTDLARPERRGRDLSFVVWAITIGAVFGPNLVAPGAVVAVALGLPSSAGAFLISAAGMIVGCAIIWWGLRPDPLLVRAELDADGKPVSGSADASSAGGWAVCRRYPAAAAVMVVMAGAHAAMVAVMTMTPVHLNHESATGTAEAGTIGLIGLTISLHIAGMFALSPIMGWLTDRVGAWRTALGGLTALLVATGGAAAFSHHTLLVISCLVLLGVGWSAATVAGSTLLVETLPAEHRVAAQGFSDAVMSFAAAAAALAGGPVMAVAGFPGVAVVAAAVSLLAVGVAARFAAR
ncbi:MFS transporter [Brooklawnia propionicigenes]|uniref:MFS transporter n=1 Tax=Brooklawnia propionicigenes TaxID=3041175 RepID=A0AAN0KDT6_9ACTN|nr:MFS transporter [Brooklawnia sp. SH051]BEH03620.1 MFS transporter [Brooklawnia sp. SH051]